MTAPPDTMADVAVAPLGDGEESLWSELLARSPYATFYHELAFSRLYAWKVDAPVNLVFRVDGQPVAVLPAGIATAADGRRELKSPFSASFAGFAPASGLSLDHTCALVAALERWAAAAGIGRILLQQPPAIYLDRADDTLEFALRRSGFAQRDTELSYYLDAPDRLSSVAARNVRKAEGAGCLFAPADDLAAIWTFLAEIKSERGQPFGVARDELLALREAFGQRVLGFDVTMAGERVAAMIAYALNARVLLGFHWAQRADAQQARPSDFLVHGVARWAFAHRFRAFDLGTTTLHGEPVWGVTRFKEKFLPGGTLRRRFVKDL